LSDISPQLRFGGGDGIHVSGYEESHSSLSVVVSICNSFNIILGKARRPIVAMTVKLIILDDDKSSIRYDKVKCCTNCEHDNHYYFYAYWWDQSTKKNKKKYIGKRLPIPHQYLN
jgi:hypothetical protein